MGIQHSIISARTLVTPVVDRVFTHQSAIRCNMGSSRRINPRGRRDHPLWFAVSTEGDAPLGTIVSALGVCGRMRL